MNFEFRGWQSDGFTGVFFRAVPGYDSGCIACPAKGKFTPTGTGTYYANATVLYSSSQDSVDSIAKSRAITAGPAGPPAFTLS